MSTLPTSTTTAPAPAAAAVPTRDRGRRASHAADALLEPVENHIYRAQLDHELHTPLDLAKRGPVTSTHSEFLLQVLGPLKVGGVVKLLRRPKPVCAVLDKLRDFGFPVRDYVYYHVVILREVDDRGRVLETIDFDPVFDGYDGPVTLERAKRIWNDMEYSRARILRGSQIDDLIGGDRVEIDETLVPPEPGTVEHEDMMARMQRAATCETYRYSLFSFSCVGFASYLVLGPNVRQACTQVRRVVDAAEASFEVTATMAGKAIQKGASRAKRAFSSAGVIGKIGIVVLAIILLLGLLVTLPLVFGLGTIGNCMSPDKPFVRDPGDDRPRPW